MNKKLIVIAGATVLIASLAFAGLAFAQTQTPPTPPYGPGYGMMGNGYGYGMMGGNGRGSYGRGMMGDWTGDYGPMHDAMFDALASGLGLTRADLDSRVANGETPAQIAASKGLSQADFANIFADARKAAMDKAVAGGYLTQEQADWMLSHTPAGVGGRGYGNGHCPYFDNTPNS